VRSEVKRGLSAAFFSPASMVDRDTLALKRDGASNVTSRQPKGRAAKKAALSSGRHQLQ